MSIWTFDLPDDVQSNLVLDLSALSVVITSETGSVITVKADESPNPLLDVTADGAKVNIRQIALMGRERFAGVWSWGPQTSRVRVAVPYDTYLDARLSAGSISAEHSWEYMQIQTSARPIRLGSRMNTQVHADAGFIAIGALYKGSVRAQAGSVYVRSTSGTVSAHTEAGSVKIVEAREETLDLSSEVGTVPVGVPEGTVVLAGCHSDFDRVTTGPPRQEHPDVLERRLELRART